MSRADCLFCALVCVMSRCGERADELKQLDAITTVYDRAGMSGVTSAVGGEEEEAAAAAAAGCTDTDEQSSSTGRKKPRARSGSGSSATDRAIAVFEKVMAPKDATGGLSAADKWMADCMLTDEQRSLLK